MHVFFLWLSFLSAFLLFQVQPVISKFILPWFGGSPGVWTTCMLFFQVVLFAGYAYAHAVVKLQPVLQRRIHAGLVLLALAFLPIVPGDFWKPSGLEEPSFRILLLLLGTVGLPYFILSSTSPLTQVWFYRRFPDRSPWRLYALSNLGSLAALLTYPIGIEPYLDVVQQTWIWSGGFIVFAILSILLARGGKAVQASSSQTADGLSVRDKTEAVSGWRRLLWVLLPMMASALLLASTNHVCQDVAVVPFMWVIPLSLYLLTYIISFEAERYYVRPLFCIVALLVIGITASEKFIANQSSWSWDPTPNYLYDLAWSFGSMFLGCLVCHAELARLKPRHSDLTTFYLCMSAGGACGGLLVSQLAPRVFTTYLEWPLALMAVFVLSLLVLCVSVWKIRSRAIRLLLCTGLAASGAFGILFLADSTLKVDDRLERARNFYGAVNVDEDYDTGLESVYRTLTHGGIIHGMQNMADAHREEPVTYYGPDTGIGRALAELSEKKDAHVAVVGMGAGTVACYARPGQRWRFYEINPVIPRLARKHFTYLADAEKRGAKVETVLGDARLMLEREAPQQFDLLLLDAFSGDSIPVHLLTREAFEIYRRHMKSKGVMVVHITNSYLALAPVVQQQAKHMNWQMTRIITEEQGDHDATDYVWLTQNEALIQKVMLDLPEKPEPKNVPLWTDKRHDLFRILMLD